MAIAMTDLKLDRLLVVYPGGSSYPLRHGADVVAMGDLEARLSTVTRVTRTRATATR